MKAGTSLRTKLFLSILIILLISYSTLIYSTIRSLDASLEEKVSQELEEDLRLVQEQYNARAREISSSLSAPASAPPVHGHIKAKDSKWLRDAMQRWRHILPYLDMLLVVDRQYRVVARVHSPLNGDRFELTTIIDKAIAARSPYTSTELIPYRTLRREGEVEYSASLPGGEAMVTTVVIPVFDDNGAALGAIVAGDVINNDQHIFTQVQKAFGSKVEVTLTQRDVRIASTYQDQFLLPMTVGPEVISRLEKNGQFRGETIIGKHRYLTAFEPLTDSSGRFIGSLSVSLSKEDIHKIRRMNLWNILSSALVGIILAFVMAFFAARRLTRPLRELARGAQRIQQGDLDHRVKVTTSDDFGMLAESFNRMVVALHERDRTITRKTLDLEGVNNRLIELNELLERKVGERTTELQMEMGRLEAILTSMAEGVVVTDRENRVILFNPAAQKLFDIVPHRVLGQQIEGVCAIGNFCRLVDVIKEMRNEGKQAVGREQETTVNGKKLKVSLNPLLDHQGNFAGVVMSMRDATIEEEMNQMKTDFISTVSHELKTPLTSMKGSLQLILSKGEGLTPTERDLLVICQRNTERLIRLISEILDISKIEAGAIDFSFKATDIKELVNYSIDEIRSFALDHNVTLTNQIPEALPAVYADQDRLIQVLTNLLANAVKFSPRGKEVRIEGAREANFIAVSVIDTGESIQWADRNKLFKKFQQFDSSEMKGRGGTGLGLAICKEIVEKHHGRIYFSPGENGGNIFTFTVPIYEDN